LTKRPNFGRPLSSSSLNARPVSGTVGAAVLLLLPAAVLPLPLLLPLLLAASTCRASCATRARSSTMSAAVLLLAHCAGCLGGDCDTPIPSAAAIPAATASAGWRVAEPSTFSIANR